jgi:hypothetical protein
MSYYDWYTAILLGVSTVAEVLILYLVWQEGRKVVSDVKDIREATSGTVYGTTDDLVVGSRVHILQPQPGVPREQWAYGAELYVIRDVDKHLNRARATPVLPPLGGPIPTVEGPMSGPLSPFKKSSVPG